MCFELKPLQTLWGRDMDRLMEAVSLLGFLYFGEEGEEETSIVKMNNLNMLKFMETLKPSFVMLKLSPAV